MKRKTALVAILLLSLLILALGQMGSVPVTLPGPDTAPAALTEKVKARLEEMHKDGEFPGLTAGFVLADGRSGAVAAGWTDADRKIPMRPTDIILAGSIGKTYVAAVMLQLVDEGRARLDDPLSKWLGGKAWFSRLPNAGQLTLRMLLQHRSGVPEHVLREDFAERLRADPEKSWRPEELVAYVLDTEPLFAADSSFSYADTNYILVGMVIEEITGSTFYTEARRRILVPLGLNDTIPQETRCIRGLIPGHLAENNPFGLPTTVAESDGCHAINPQMEWTGGGMATTAVDLARWARALYGGRVLSEQSLAAMLDAREGDRRVGSKYGLGVQVWETEQGVSYGHMGWFPGYASVVEYWPGTGIAVAVQFNTDNLRTLKRSLRSFTVEIARILQEAGEEKH